MTGSIGRRLLIGSLAGLALTAMTRGGAAQTDTRPTLAVMTFTNGAIGAAQDWEPLTVGMPELMIAQLATNPKIRVIDRSNLLTVMKEQDLDASARVDQATAAKLGKILGAGHMIFGGFVIDPKGTMRITARSVNVETTVVEFSTDVEGNEADVMALLDQLAGKLNSGLKLPAIDATVRKTSMDQAKKVPLQATLLYSRALQANESGNKDQAVQYLQKVIKDFPEFGEAQQALKKIQPASGTD